MDRRSFLRLAFGAALATAASRILPAAETPIEPRVRPFDDDCTIGCWHVVSITEDDVIEFTDSWGRAHRHRIVAVDRTYVTIDPKPVGVIRARYEFRAAPQVKEPKVRRLKQSRRTSWTWRHANTNRHPRPEQLAEFFARRRGPRGFRFAV